MNWDWDDYDLVGGLEHFFSIIYGIILPIDSYFSRWLKPPTSDDWGLRRREHVLRKSFHSMKKNVTVQWLEARVCAAHYPLRAGWCLDPVGPGSWPPQKWGVFPSKKTVQIESVIGWVAFGAFGCVWALMDPYGLLLHCCMVDQKRWINWPLAARSNDEWYTRPAPSIDQKRNGAFCQQKV